MNDTVRDPRFTTGRANWKGFTIPIDEVLDVAASWRESFSGIEKPWLCWNVDSDWCVVQQKLAISCGWTPVVGGDPRSGTPEILPQSTYIDFNSEFKLPNMHFLFPLEFAWLYADKIAFWHSDLLIRQETLKDVVKLFEKINDGDMVVTEPTRSFKMKLLCEPTRYWELLGCTTKSASESQFKNGSGWFSNIIDHPNCTEEDKKDRSKVYWDHGSGVEYWHRKYADKTIKIIKIPEKKIEEGHCTRIRNPNYVPQSPNNEKRDLSKDLSHNYSLKDECERMGLLNFL